MSNFKKSSNLESFNHEESIFKEGVSELLVSRLSAIISAIGYDEFITILSERKDSISKDPEKFIRGMFK